MTQFSETLRTWRATRKLSQLELAVEAEVSARHISFLETGRSRPSREMIARLGEALRLPLSARNQMLGHAGFAARYSSSGWDAESMAPIRAALDHTLAGHAPYPAIAADHEWTIVKMNPPASALLGIMGLHEGTSLIDLVLRDELEPFVENWPQVAHHSALRLRTESAAQGGVARLDEAAAKLSEVPYEGDEPLSPVIPTVFVAGGQRLALFSTIAQFGTPVDMTLDDLKIELFFPADTATRQLLQQMSSV
ncbi:MAG: helix-turn-helix domain-containing protein [Gammaproteobacteria bacterium]